MNGREGDWKESGAQGKDVWDGLTEEEQEVIAGKLDVLEGEAASDREVRREAFNRIFVASSTRETTVLAVTVKNFIDNAGGRSNSEVWQQITALRSAWIGGNDSASIEFHVNDTEGFLQVLKRNGFEVDAWYEKINFRGYHRHSARFITETSYEPGMHFVQQKFYSATRFDVHWDSRSAAFNTWDTSRHPLTRPFIWVARSVERLLAGLSHDKPKSSFETREALRSAGIAPPAHNDQL